jgi:hypothetical protein
LPNIANQPPRVLICVQKVTARNRTGSRTAADRLSAGRGQPMSDVDTRIQPPQNDPVVFVTLTGRF